MIDVAGVSRVAVIGAAVLAVIVVVLLERRQGSRPLAAVRRRLLFGVPWGTLVSAAFVVGVYLFVQGGWGNWFDPVVTPFRAWSYLAPLGVALAGFAHAGPGHLLGNLIGTLTLAPLVEYAVSHYPTKRGSSLTTLRHNPYVRAFLLFPAAVVLVGLASSVFSLGPVIGFSGVVFAFAGFAVVRYPLGTVVALTAGDVLSVGWRAIQRPVTVASGRPAFITPWWADIAIHGHAFGLLTGVVAAGLLFRARDTPLPSPRRLLAGSLFVAVSQSLWAVYWFRGNGEFILFRAIGLALVVGLAVLITALAVERTPQLSVGGLATDGSGDDQPSDGGFQWLGDEGGPTTDDRPGLVGSLRRGDVGAGALLVLLVVVALLAGAAVPTNLLAVGGQPLPNEPVEVRGYQVGYAEGVENGMVSVVDVEGFGLSTNVQTSGVIVRNPERGVWTTVVSKQQLAFAGSRGVTLGGVGWRDSVRVTREGYSVVGGGAVYRVSLAVDDQRRVVYTADSAQAAPRVAGWNVSVALRDGEFRLVAARNGTNYTTRLPGENETVTAGGLQFVRQDRAILAVAGGPDNRTVVRVAAKEQYRGQSDG